MSSLHALNVEKLSEPPGPWFPNDSSNSFSGYKIFINEKLQQIYSVNSEKIQLEQKVRTLGSLTIQNASQLSNLLSPLISIEGEKINLLPKYLFFIAFPPKEGWQGNYSFEPVDLPINFQIEYFINDHSFIESLEQDLLISTPITLTIRTKISSKCPIYNISYATPELEGEKENKFIKSTHGIIKEKKALNDKEKEIILKTIDLNELKPGEIWEIVQTASFRLSQNTKVNDFIFGETRISYMSLNSFSDLSIHNDRCLTEVTEELELEKTDTSNQWKITSKLKNESTFLLSINKHEIFSNNKLKFQKHFNPPLIVPPNNEWVQIIDIDTENDEKNPIFSHNIDYIIPITRNIRYDGIIHFFGFKKTIKPG